MALFAALRQFPEDRGRGPGKEKGPCLHSRRNKKTARRNTDKMKRFLALILAISMMVSGSVLALAEETTEPAAPAEGAGDTATPEETPATPEETPTTPEENPTEPTEPTTPAEPDTPEETTPEDTVDRDAPITLDGYYPGETIKLTWSILMSPNSTQNVRIETDLKIKEWDHKNTAEFNPKIVETSGIWEYAIQVKNPLTSVEDVGKTIEDTIDITLEDGKTYSFPLVVTYRAGALISCQNQLHVFTLGQQVKLNVNVIDPADIFGIPQDVGFLQGTAADVESGQNCPEENRLLRVDEITFDIDRKKINITVTPIKTGVEQVCIHAIDANGHGYGQSWQIQVIEEGQEPDKTTVYSSRTENQASQDAALDAIEAINEAIASGAALPAKAQTVTTANGASATVVSAKLYGLDATLSVDTMQALADSKVGLRANLDNGAAEVIIPGGFTMPTGAGVLGYSLGFQADPVFSNIMKSDVKGENAKTEVYRIGGGVLPTTATITIKTKLTGKVNVYYWDEDTRRYTLLDSPTVEGKKLTFATKQLGNLVFTTGTI